MNAAMADAIPEAVEAVARSVVDGAFQVHMALGPGLLESAYEHCLTHELAERRGMRVNRQVTMPVRYGDTIIDAGYRLDLLVEDAVIVEVKAVESLLPIHEAQLLTYLRLSGLRLGFLMNFNVKLFKFGIRRFVL